MSVTDTEAKKTCSECGGELYQDEPNPCLCCTGVCTECNPRAPSPTVVLPGPPLLERAIRAEERVRELEADVEFLRRQLIAGDQGRAKLNDEIDEARGRNERELNERRRIEAHYTTATLAIAAIAKHIGLPIDASVDSTIEGVRQTVHNLRWQSGNCDRLRSELVHEKERAEDWKARHTEALEGINKLRIEAECAAAAVQACEAMRKQRDGLSAFLLETLDGFLSGNPNQGARELIDELKAALAPAAADNAPAGEGEYIFGPCADCECTAIENGLCDCDCHGEAK